MRGKHHIVIESPRLKYEFDVKRNITIIRGDSATGKTTLIDLLEDYRNDEDSAVRISSDVPCRVFADNSDTWRQALEIIVNSVVFIDEDNRFIHLKDFANLLRSSTNYFVLITREALPELPYSVNEIYGIRTTGRFHFPEQIYHEFYPLYGNYEEYAKDAPFLKRIITEDRQSGYQFFESFTSNSTLCVGAGGNSQIYHVLSEQADNVFLAVIADGAAFGAYIEKVMNYADIRRNIILYFPESFEWLLLRSGVASDRKYYQELDHPEDYIDGECYMSWEQFFTDLLKKETQNDNIRQYQKSNLPPYYMSRKVRERILQIMPAELKDYLQNLEGASHAEQ